MLLIFILYQRKTVDFLLSFYCGQAKWFLAGHASSYVRSLAHSSPILWVWSPLPSLSGESPIMLSSIIAWGAYLTNSLFSCKSLVLLRILCFFCSSQIPDKHQECVKSMLGKMRSAVLCAYSKLSWRRPISNIF